MSDFAAGSRKSLLPGVLVVLALGLLAFWFLQKTGKPLDLRIPGTDRAPGAETGPTNNPVLAGKVTSGDGLPADLPGAWPGFRGPQGSGMSPETNRLARSWPNAGPRELWGVDVGEGYAGPSVLNGRVYLMDYDREKKQDALRCFSLADGREIWRFAYPVSVKRNHGMSRTIPTVTEKTVVAMGPKCHVAAVSATTGELKWALDLVRDYEYTVPQWYAGQCPLIEGDRVILAPGGPAALMIALDLETGKELWRTANPREWKMTHSSIVPMEVLGERIYVYCAHAGVVGVSAKNGALLWETTDWKISIATVPTPVLVGRNRMFLSGGYNAGSLMLEVTKTGDKFAAKTVFRLGPEVFGATQQTPMLHEDHLYGARADGKFVCLNLEGKVVWASDAGQQFGLGSYLAADGLIYAVNDSGLLRLIELTPEKYRLLAQAQILKGRESWAPMAIVGSRLLVRDLTRMVCLEAK